MSRKLSICMILLLIVSAFAQAQVIKLASVAPEATPWGEGVNRIASEWNRISGGRVRVQVFHGGIAGDEEDTIRKMRLGQLQASVLTSAGLSSLVPEMLGISFPGVISSDDELDYVLENFEDELNALFDDYGYEILTWSRAGWLNLFSVDEVTVPSDLRGMKIAAGTVPEQINQAFRNLGMQPVPVATNEMLSSLNSGLVDSLIYSPLGVAGYQWFGVADHMLDMEISPFLGAILIDQRSWNRIPEEFHQPFRDAARRIGREIEDQLDTLEQQANDLMTTYGLQITTVDAAARQQWLEVFQQQSDVVGGNFLSNSFMEQVIEGLNEYRRSQS